MKAVVTGGGGFIGSHVVDLLLERGWWVYVIDKNAENAKATLAHHGDEPRLKISQVDIRNVNGVFGGVDAVIHLAGMMDLVPSIERPHLYMDVNCLGTVAVLEAARAAGVKRFVYAASSSCYGENPPFPTKEDAPIDCVHPYALSKWMGEQAAFHWMRVYKLPVNSIRIFNAYGPRLRGSNGAYGAVFGIFMKQKLEGKPFTVVGDGEQGRDFVYVTDVAEAFVKAATTEHVGQVWNIGGGQPQSVNRIIECMGGGEVVHLPKRPGEPDTTWADISKAKAELGWEPKVSFPDGVRKTMEDIASFAHIPLWTPETIKDATAQWFKELA